MLVSAGSVALAFIVGSTVKDVKVERDDALAAEQDARDARRLAESELDKTESRLAEANSRLSQVEDALNQAQIALEDQRDRANGLESDLSALREEHQSVTIELQKWRLTGLTVDQALALRSELREANQRINGLVSENTALSREVAVLDNRLKIFESEDYEVKLPSQLSATVTAVDPKFAFVVINVGAEDSVLEEAKFSISRNQELIAKVQVSSVESGHSFANVLPGWNIQDIRPGDRVIPSYEAIAQK